MLLPNVNAEKCQLAFEFNSLEKYLNIINLDIEFP